jgi:S-adenosylmethionine:tRNA ribosyltransferase-isomerase
MDAATTLMAVKHDMENREHLLNSYEYDLPEEAIAQEPCGERGASRLLVLDRATGDTTVSGFDRLEEFLPSGSLLVGNNSKVIPARLLGRRPTGAKVEVLLLTPAPLIAATDDQGPWRSGLVEALLRTSKSVKPGDEVVINDEIHLVVEEVSDYGRCTCRLEWRGNLTDILMRVGRMPLPPYIRRADNIHDRKRYQTVYARSDKQGSVAAPTAGLHFTEEHAGRLAEAGMEWAELTLYVGYGTFSPVRVPDIRDHAMHAEYVEIPAQTASKVVAARNAGRPVVAVGTTAVRALEGVHAEMGGMKKFKGWVDIFIRPGFEFRVVDRMVTNFHLPGSSLLIMVSAFAGRKPVLDAYAKALEQGFRFYSYGDAMLIG